MIFDDCRVNRTLPVHGCGTFTFSSTPFGKPSFKTMGDKPAE